MYGSSLECGPCNHKTMKVSNPDDGRKLRCRPSDAPCRADRFPSNEATIRRSPEAGELRRRLLAIGGNRVYLQVPDPDLPALLSRGRTFPTEGVRRRRLARNQCHRNVATLWCNAPGRVRIATGYALSDDGLWQTA